MTFSRTGIVANAAPAQPRFVMYASPNGCMSPTLKAGDLAEVDTSDVKVAEGLFLLQFEGGQQALRRLQPRPNGRVRVSIDVAPHAAEELDERELAGKIIGRVVKIWNGTQIAGVRS